MFERIERVDVEVEGAGRPRRPRGSFLALIPGMGFLGLGVSVLVWPKILIYMVACAFMLIGLGLLIAARGVNRVRRKMSAFQDSFRF